MTKIIIVVGANVLFFGVFILIWWANKQMPKWEARSKARQQARQRELEDGQG